MTSLSPMEMKPLISSPTTGGEGVTVGGVAEGVGSTAGVGGLVTTSGVVVVVGVTVLTGSGVTTGTVTNSQGEESSVISVVVGVDVGGVV